MSPHVAMWRPLRAGGMCDVYTLYLINQKSPLYREMARVKCLSPIHTRVDDKTAATDY